MSTTPPDEPTNEQPTQAYPPADQQPTEAYAASAAGYGAAYEAPAAPAYPPAEPTPTGYPAQPGYPQQYAPAPAAPDTRPKAIAWTALALAGVGFIATLIGFIPVLWVGLVSVIIGGLLLLAGFIFALIGLISKRNGGKGLSITALVLSVVGAGIGVFALVFSLVLIGLSASGSSTEELLSPEPMPSVAVTDGAVDEGTDEGDAGAETPAGEAAFIADVRPKVTAILQEIDPSATPELVETAFPDDTLVLLGQSLLVTGESGIDAIVEQTIAGAGGGDAVAAEQLRRLYLEILASAQTHLQ